MLLSRPHRLSELMLVLGWLWAWPFVALAQPELGTSPVQEPVSEDTEAPPDEALRLDDTEPEGEGLAGHGFAEFRLSYYKLDDTGGNPFLDEDLEVVEPVFIFDYNITDHLAIYGKLAYDHVSSASIDRLSIFPDQSGASADNYLGFEAGFRHQLTDVLRYGGFFHASTEYDYDSYGLGAHVSRDLANKNATVKLSLNGFFDNLDVIRGASKLGLDEGSDDRMTVSTTLNWYQVIDTKTHGELGTTFSYQDGFLETAYNDVVIEDPTGPLIPGLENARGTAVTEELNSNRFRTAVFGRVRRFFDPGFSLEMGGRAYTDSWGINSLTLEPRLYTWLVKNRLSARVRYRFYVQTEADDYERHFFAVQGKRTQDADLADFMSHGVGLKLQWFVTDSWKLDGAVDYIFHSEDLDQLLLTMGVRYDF